MDFKIKPNPVLNFIRRIFIILKIDFIIRRFTIGKKSSEFIGKLVPNNYQYPKNTIRKFNYKGIWLEVDIRDYVSHYLYFGFEDKAQEKLIALAKNNFTVLDIGTNIGFTLLQFANKVGEKGFVYGFEPDPINFKACMHNISLNTFKNIYVENIGLGNKKGEFNLMVDTETNRGGNRITLNNINTGKEINTIKVEKLDDWVKRNPIHKIDLIKIDVEGFETNIIKGGIESIKKYKPILFIEVDDNNLKSVNSSARELIALLDDLNYTIINAETDKRVISSDTFTNCHFDVICK